MSELTAKSDDILICVEGLKKYYPIKGGLFKKASGHVKAVDDVTFNIRRHEVLGIAGESGCGKSTTGRVMLRLQQPTAGRVLFEGTDLNTLTAEEMRLKRQEMQEIFQDPYASLNPWMKVGDIIEEPLFAFGIGTKEERRKRVREMMDVCGLAAKYTERYPHEFSGGQRQRICSQIINLFQDLQKEFGLTYMFISHDLSVMHYISDRVGVMYLGRMVEIADCETLFNNPLHPYTQAHLSAVPVADPHVEKNRQILQGDVPSPSNTPKGCAFASRCVKAMPICFEERPADRQCGNTCVACHLY